MRARIRGPPNMPVGCVNRWLAIERGVVFGERSKRGLGLPRHVGVALTTVPLVEHFTKG
jgi:hypothetical protein